MSDIDDLRNLLGSKDNDEAVRQFNKLTETQRGQVLVDLANEVDGAVNKLLRGGYRISA